MPLVNAAIPIALAKPQQPFFDRVQHIIVFENGPVAELKMQSQLGVAWKNIQPRKKVTMDSTYTLTLSFTKG